MSSSDEKQKYNVSETVIAAADASSSNNEKDYSKVEAVSISDEPDVEELAFIEPSLATRMFYAQRFVEKQYEEVKKDRGSPKALNDFIKKSLTIKSLLPKTNNYPTWSNDNLSLRSTHWIVCAGLLTSEIMGAFLVPNSVALIGYVPSNILLTVCFFLTITAGAFTWWMFMLFDSPEYPIKSLAEIGYILGGKPTKQLVIFLQVVAMILTAATTFLGGAEAIIVIREQRICWAVVLIVLCVGGCIVGCVKRLSHIGKFCLVVSFCNYINLFVQLKYFKSGTVNWDNAKAILGLDQAPIIKYAIAPGTLVNKVVAVSNISYVFAGSIVFPELLSEMRRPWDFWKSMVSAQTIIFAIYLIYGNFIYSYQGQFANSPAVFGISNISAMRGLSFITFVTGFIQGVFYAHVSSKIFYKNYLSKIFKRLKYHSKTGELLWIATNIVVWIVVFIIAAGVPQVSAISSFTSALSMIPLTYCIPFVFQLWAMYHRYSAEVNFASYDETTMTLPEATETLSKNQKILFLSGFKKYVLFSTFILGIALAALAFSGIGIWASVEYMKLLFETAAATSFSCTSPI